jgi:small subunit ribosomal protein S6
LRRHAVDAKDHKEGGEQMPNKYETLILFSPDLTTEDRQQIMDRLSGVVSQYDGQVLEVDDWGMKELAYGVNKYHRGRYVRLEYGSEGDAVAELERRIRIAEGILKFITVKLEDDIQLAQEA